MEVGGQLHALAAIPSDRTSCVHGVPQRRQKCTSCHSLLLRDCGSPGNVTATGAVIKLHCNLKSCVSHSNWSVLLPSQFHSIQWRSFLDPSVMLPTLSSLADDGQTNLISNMKPLLKGELCNLSSSGNEILATSGVCRKLNNGAPDCAHVLKDRKFDVKKRTWLFVSK